MGGRFDRDNYELPETYDMEFEKVVSRHDDGWWISRDVTYGLYCEYVGDGWGDENLELVNVMWPSKFERRTGFHDGREVPYLLYERDGSNAWPGASEHCSYRSHIVQNGETICRTSANVPSPTIVEGEKEMGWTSYEVPYPTFDLLKPVSSLTEDWKKSVPLCTHCRQQSRSRGVLPGHEE